MPSVDYTQPLGRFGFRSQLTAAVSALQVAGASKRTPGGTVERPAELVDSAVGTIQYVHSEVAGHRGVKATVDTLLRARAGYNRSNLQQEDEYVIANCGFCQKIANCRQDDDKSQPRFLESIFIDQATPNGTRPNSPSGVKPARPLVGRYFKVQFRG